MSVWGGGVYVGECVGQGPVHERGGGVYVGECVGGEGYTLVSVWGGRDIRW